MGQMISIHVNTILRKSDINHYNAIFYGYSFYWYIITDMLEK